LPIELPRPLIYRPPYAHLTALGLGGVVLAVNRTLLYPLLDAVAGDLSLTAAQSGFIASLYFIGLLTSQIVLSFFGERWGLKRVLVAAYFAGAFVVLGLGLWATGYAILLLFVGLQGLTMGVFWPSAYSLAVAGVPAQRRGRASAVVGVGLAAGHALGPALSGVLYQLAGGWRLPFAFMALPTLLLAVAFFSLVQSAPRLERQTYIMSWAPVLRDRNLIALFVAGFCTLCGLWAITVWGPAFLQAERGLSLVASGLYVALAIAVAGPAGFLLGRWSDRLGRRWLSASMFLLCAAGLALMALARSEWILLIALLACGAGSKFAWDPMQIAWLADLTAHDATKALGQVVALASTIGMSSAIVSPAIYGWIRDQTGSLQGAFLLGAVLAVMGAVLCASAQEHA
jgi:ACS family tartrate transporter-like MFS transporter